MPDATDPMRERAAAYPEIAEGTACTQSSFKRGKTAFFFIGQQGGRHKAMFKLDASFDEAVQLAASQPDRYQAGKKPWVTARFTDAEPMPEELWTRWMDESWEISGPKKRR